MLKAGLIGYGYWGPNLLRNLFQSRFFNEIVLCEIDKDRREQARLQYPGLATCISSQDLYSKFEIDVIFIATPSSTHYKLAKEALLEGKHLLLEKPFTLNKNQCIELLDIAERKNLKVITDHTYVYNPFIQKTKEIITKGDFGELNYYHSNRVNLGNFQNDTNVIWDLAIHDISIILHLFEDRPSHVSAIGFKYKDLKQECLSYCTFMFDNAIAHANVSWLSPVKIRDIVIGGSKRMIAIDELHNVEKIKVYDKGVDINPDPSSIHKMMISYRTGDIWSPVVNASEALALEIDHFASVILEEAEPLTGPKHIFNSMCILEALEMSVKSYGTRIAVNYDR